MRVLVLGGTRFVGRRIVAELHASGHAVTTFNRGAAPDDLPAQVERLHGDRDLGSSGLSQLRGRSWDACIDVSGYTAVQVRASASALRTQVGRYVFISAVSVYGDATTTLDEGADLVPAAPDDVTSVVGEMYGRLKVTCERIVRQELGGRATILRPQVIAGPADPTPRVSYWVRRAQQPGTMLAPGDGTDFLQVVDVEDVARFTVKTIERDLSDTYNLSGERVPWSSFIEMLAPQEVCWVAKSIIEESGLTFMDLPLYRPVGSPRSGLMDIRNERAVRAGFAVTPLRATLDRVRGWLTAAAPDPRALSPDVERSLIRLQLTARR